MITHITYFIIYFFYCHGFELCGEHLAKGLEQNRSLKPVKLDGSLSPQHQELHETSTHSCTSVHTLEGGGAVQSTDHMSKLLGCPTAFSYKTSHSTALSEGETI